MAAHVHRYLVTLTRLTNVYINQSLITSLENAEIIGNAQTLEI